MKALMFLTAVFATAAARPGSLASVETPTPDAASSTARTNSHREADADVINPPQISRNLQNPLPESLETPRPVNPALADSLSDGGDDSTAMRFVDNPHIGLPFGTLLTAPVRISASRVPPTASSADVSNTIRRDSPHVGLPPIIPSPESLASTTTVSSPASNSQTGTTSERAFGNSNILTEEPSKEDTVSKLSINTSPASLRVNTGAIHFGDKPKIRFANCLNPVILKILLPKNLPSTNYFSTFGDPIYDDTSSESSSLPTDNYHTNLLVSSQNKVVPSYPVNSVPSSTPSHIPLKTASFGFPSSSPYSNSVTNVAFTTNKPTPILPINSPSSQTSFYHTLLVNSDNAFLFSESVPDAKEVDTSQGTVIVAGPFNVAIFQKRPKLDDFNQVMAAHGLEPIPEGNSW